jgi:type IV secretory pathway VirB2 component (pilin)
MAIYEILKQFAAELKQGGTVNIPTLTGDQVLQNGLNIVYFAAGVTAVVVIIIGGIMYATSVGEPGKINNAKNMIVFAVVGLVIVLSAFAITNFVIGGLS